MRRRTFLGLMGTLAAGAISGAGARPTHAAADRLTWWDPAPTSTQIGNFVALEWRYLAARIRNTNQDFGFVISLADYNPFPQLGISGRNELLVMRTDFAASQQHATATYPGTLSYDAQSATYQFVGTNQAITASWRLDTSAQRYTLAVNTPELTLDNLLITPVGDLIPEGGTGTVRSGRFSFNGLPVEAISDYYADWVTLSSAGTQVGLGRLDMQTIRPNIASGAGPNTYSHHWFALDAILDDDSRAWVSGWQIVTGAQTAWGVTVARGQGAGWSVASIGTDSSFAGKQPLAVTILEYQAVPNVTPARRTGKRWRLQAGQAADGDVIDLEFAVPPGQFIQSARVAAVGLSMQESVATGAGGTIGGKAIKFSSLAVMESTFSEPGSPPVQQKVYLPMVRQ